MPTISTLTVDVTSRTSKFSTGLKVVTGGLALLATGAAIAFKQFEDAEKISNQTAAVLESTGHAAHVSAAQVDELAQSIMTKTGIDDEAIASGENLLLTFKNISNEVGAGNNIFDQATVAITDMSVAMGQDMKSSAIQVGKALNDPIAGMTALSRVGVQFTEAQKAQIAQMVEHNNLLGAQKIILGELSSEFAGSAEAQKTASQTMSTALGNLAEVAGGLLAPAVAVLATALQSLVAFLQANAAPAFEALKNGLTAAWDAMQPLVSAIGDFLVPLLTEAWNVIVNDLLPGLKKMAPIFKVIGVAVLAFGTMIVAQFALAIVVVGKVIGILGVLIEWFMKVVDWVREHLAAPIVGAFQTVIEKIGDVIGWVKDKLLGAWQAIKGPVLDIIHAISSAIETLIGWIKSAVDWIGQLTQGVGDALAKAGEARGVFDDINVGGPHTKAMPALSLEGGGGVNITLNGDLAALVESVDQELAGKKRRNVVLAHHGR